jgi:tetratricopeptide (TPR) repeat protein
LEGVDPAVVQAIDSARWRVRLLPWSAAAWGRLGSVLFIHDFNAAAEICLAEAERLDANQPRWPYLRARSLAEHDPDAALPVLQHSIDLCGEEPVAPRLQLAEMLVERGRLDEAERYFLQVHARDPEDGRACLGLGRVALARGKLPESLSYLQRSAVQAPHIKATHVLLAAVHQRSGNPQAADRELGQAALLEEFPVWPDPFLGEAMGMRVGLDAELSRARRFRAEGRAKEEIDLLRRLVVAYPESDRGWEMLGSAYDRLGDLDSAEQALRTAVRLAPKSVVAQMQMGVVFFHQGQYPEALKHFRSAVLLKPDLAAAHFNLGQCLTKQGDFAAAIEPLRQATRLKPDLAEAHAELGIALFVTGAPAEAVEPLREALRLKPNDPRTSDFLQQALRAAGAGRK